MKYKHPSSVTSPRRYVRVLSVLHEGTEDSFSIARIEWEGKPRVGIRWNVSRGEWSDEAKVREEKECIGMPSSRGYPTWFVLPEDLLDKNSEAWKAIERSKTS